MAQTKTRSTFELEEAPQGAPLSVIEDEDAHYLRVTLDKAENFKVAAGQKLDELERVRFRGNRNALRDWYQDEVYQGKAHRAWATVESYLRVVQKYGDRADEEFERRKKLDTDQHRLRRAAGSAALSEINNLQEDNEINDLEESATIADLPTRRPKDEYAQRSSWLGKMDYLWFNGKKEWQKRWLQQRWNELLAARNS